jgi:hypothetical protein
MKYEFGPLKLEIGDDLLEHFNNIGLAFLAQMKEANDEFNQTIRDGVEAGIDLIFEALDEVEDE